MKWLLASDLDGTLLGDEAMTRAFAARMHPSRDKLLLAYVTGRHLSAALEVIQSAGLPLPDALIPCLGASIHLAPDWERLSSWDLRLSQNWSSLKVQAIAACFPSLVLQPPENQNDFKCSFTLSPDRAETVLPALEAHLRQEGANARIVYSSGRDLDIIPRHGGKGHAVRFLAEQFDLPLSQVCTFGDSGNDRDMLSLGCHAAVVANAQSELDQGLPEQVYRARASYAAGVIEALDHFGCLI